MSTYTQDITHLINKIDTNIPDNDTQYITAARIRDAMGAVAYNYDLYVLKSQLNQELGSYVSQDDLQSALEPYVLKTDLDTAGYVTASALSGYATQDDLQTGMQSVLDDSYAYVVEKINEIPGVDLSAYVDYDSLQSYLGSYVTKSQLRQELGSYVTKTELSEMGYITEAALDGLATEAYVEDYVAHHTPTPDLSAYVTKTELSEAGYLTSIPSEYIIDTELSYVLSTASYVTSNELSQMGYITNSTLSQASYVTTTSLQSTLESYVTQQGLSAMGYITAAQVPTPDLSIYVTKTELSNASYVTQQGLSGMGYVTNTALSQMSYVTTSQLNTKQDTLVSGTNIKTINNQTLLGSGNITITSSGIISEVTQTEYDAMQQAGTLDPDTIYIITDAAPTDLSYYVLQSDLENMGYVTTSQLPNMNDYVSKTELDSMSYATTTQLNAKQNTLVSGTNIKTINNESLLGSGNITIQGSGEANVIESISVNGTTQSITNKNVDITVPTNTNQLTNGAGFLTSTIFQYDSLTNTLTISI